MLEPEELEDEPLEDVEPLETEAPAPEEEKPLRDLIAEEWEAAEAADPAGDRARDERGRFAKKEESSEQVPGTPEAPPIEPPKFWAADKKAAFATLPKDVQEYILNRENERDEFANHAASRMAAAERDTAALKQAVEPFRERLGLAGHTVPQAVHQLLTWHEFLERDPVNGLRKLAEQYGLSPEQFMSAQGGQSQAHDPRLQGLQQEVSQLRGFLAQQHEGAQLARVQSVESEIQAFRDAVGDDGKPARPHYGAVERHMITLIPAIRQQMPQASYGQLLAAAYDQAVYAHPETRQAMLAADAAKRDAERKQKIEAARRAGSSINGSGMVGRVARTQPQSLREELEAAWDEHH